MTGSNAIAERVAALPWPELEASPDAQGFAQSPRVLTAAECQELAGLYDADHFRSTITMARHCFGEGEYKYFGLDAPRSEHADGRIAYDVENHLS